MRVQTNRGRDMEREKLQVEIAQALANTAKLNRDTALAPWALVVSAVTAGAALMGAAVAIAKYLM